MRKIKKIGLSLVRSCIHHSTGLHSLAKGEHKSECYEERSSDEKKCLRTCLCFCHFFCWYWLRWSTWSYWSRRWYYCRDWSFELVGYTLIVSIGSSFCRSLYIGRVRYDWESEHTDHFTIFLISLIESISSIDICFDPSYLLSRREDKWSSRSTSTRPEDITRILPDTCFWGWTRRPRRIAESDHIRRLLLIFIGCEWAWRHIGPVIEESCETDSHPHRPSVKTLITVIDSECWIRITADALIFACWRSSDSWESRCCCEYWSHFSWSSRRYSICREHRSERRHRKKCDDREDLGSHKREKKRNKYTWTYYVISNLCQRKACRNG